MRYVPRDSLRSDMTLARAVLGQSGETMMHAGSRIRHGYISLMRKYGINGAFVEDALSVGLEIPDILPAELRAHAIACVYDAYSQAIRRRRAEDSGALLEVSAQFADTVGELGGEPPCLLDVKSYDYCSYFHVLHVAFLSALIGHAMGLEREILCELAYAGLLHDVGKMFIDARIVSKSEALTYEEMEFVRRHPQQGQRFIRQKYPEINSEDILRGVMEHHERLDGSGYPFGLSAPDISDFAKILAVADVYDAMTSERPYRAPAAPAQTLAYLREGKGTLFDTDVVDAFFLRAAPYPVGTCVQLSNGTVALVTRNDAECMSRPDVRVFLQAQKPVKPYLMSLASIPPEEVFIAGPLDI